MEFEVFENLLEGVRGTPIAMPSDRDIKAFDSWVATENDIQRAEAQLGVRLPGQYKEFMRRYGGGVFLFLELLPVASPDGREEDLVEVNQMEGLTDFIAISPVGTGDWWGFRIVDGVCQGEVDFYTWEDGSVSRAAADFLEFVAKRGLRVGE